MTEVKTELQSSIDDVTNAVAAINATQAGIADLRQRYEGVLFPVDTPKGMKDAKAARQEIRKPRYEIERLRKEAKAPILALGKQLDATAKELTAEVLAIEGPIDQQITDYEAKLEAERQAKIEAEMKRVEGIQARVADIRSTIEPIAWNSCSDDINAVLQQVEKIVIDESFAEFWQQASDAKGAVIAKLNDMLRVAKDREEEEKKIAAERAELERLRAEAVEREAQELAKREAQEAEERKAREAEEAKRREEMAEQQRKIDAENDRLARAKIAEARRQEIVNQINIVRSLPSQSYGLTAAELTRLLARAEGFAVPESAEDDADLRKEAEAAKAVAVNAIKASLTGRQKYEAEQAELAREKAEREQREKEEAERKEKAAAAAKKARYPGDQSIVDALIMHFSVTEEISRKWLAEYGKKAKAA